ncbi:MAG: type II secretion system F family protein [Lentisphaeria bacterium]|nr:type II secretion system F family protein [Lentisphaeria bacterium]
MPLFKYKVSDPAGKVSEVLIEGDSQSDAARRVQRRGLIPLAFLGEGAAAQERKGLSRKAVGVVAYPDRLVPLLEANIPLERSLAILGDEPDNPPLQRLVGDLRRGLHEGRKLSDLIRDQGSLFPPVYSGVVAAGEEAGALPQVMAQLRNFLTTAAELKSFIISSSIYPGFIAVAGIAMLSFVLGVIVPKFATSLAGAGIKSQATDFLMAVSGAVRSYWWMILVLAAGIVWMVHEIRKADSPLRRWWDRTTVKLPIFGKLVLFSNLSRFARTMSILMRSGVPLLNTVSIANRVIQNLTMRGSLDEVAGELRQGQKISGALSKSKYIPSMMLRMISVGEETGNVEEMLDRVADRYEADLRKSIKRLLSLFEPLIIVLLGIGIGLVVLLMFTAIMDMQHAV